MALRGFDWWRQTVQSPRYVLAPMVDQSEWAFRELCRRYGVELAYSPMVHVGMAWQSPAFINKMFPALAESGPLIVQLASPNAEKATEVASRILDRVDVAAFDLNLGCPQKIAKRGRYGAFLLERDIDAAAQVIAALDDLAPVTAKVRLLDSFESSRDAYRRLVDAGASMLCIHGRNRVKNKQFSGAADWDAVRRLRDEFAEVPVIANGGVSCFNDAEAALDFADAVMSSEAILDNPALFAPHARVTQRQLAAEYLVLAKEGDSFNEARAHLFKLLHGSLKHFTAERDALAIAKSWGDYDAILASLDERDPDSAFDARHSPAGVADPAASWYWRHRKDEYAPTSVDDAPCLSRRLVVN